ncbi:hypothetical protein P175DRAFT_0527038 [Aspergillus ochraceoroseus IBT 24754]|uniref:Uncharacterized protein n=1 Tax=Aspergillus ochraceoroseus IBT 24754 TaxID=1392256 RepID=A0A2T5LKS3_9EURO|nr:uncharacterized protein P175DRAFT_0527038 [Aspergillus ochraceoroseus IBT 24754]PTU16881.1 hypothetical protein P175DRAFT_0527038 [Aspergillus ochraceoroseus IBT 24754]
MAPDPANQYLLPPISELLPPETVSSWSPFETDASPDRAHIRYEPAPATELATPPVGLGIHTSPDREVPAHSRCDSYTETLASDRAASRFADSETTLVGEPGRKYPTRKTIVQRRLSWIPLTVLVLAIYSTIFSGIFLIIACVKPRYGRVIGVDGRLAPSTANLLSALFAKTIELAYVTVCVAFLGQVLTRRAITRGSRGISISDMSMRSWIMQPGSLIVHWESLRYSGWTILGAITLTATLVAMLYTTAAEALVSPKLVMSPVENKVLVGNVYTQFANPYYLADNCQTPIPLEMDPDYRNTTCLDLQHAGQAYHNYQGYLQTWSSIASGSNSTSSMLDSRPPPTGSLNDNTSVIGSWIDRANITELSQRYSRMVINVTAAMPHGGIIAAAMNGANGIEQPQDLSGEGNYHLDASVPSPAVNVLCVGMNATELAPLVYTEWPNTKGEFDAEEWVTDPPADIPVFPNWLNRTVVDEIFGFGPKYGQRPPIFGKLPDPYNTILNVTGVHPANAIYLLGATPNNTTPEYVMCSFKAKQTPLCSTRYEVTGSGAALKAVCEHPGNSLQYNARNPDALDGIWQPDWKNIASEWAMSLSLGTGITDSRAATARLLMQFVPKTLALDPTLPSISEALAVLVGNTLLMSSTDAPFVPFWNYTDSYFTDPVPQIFNATVSSVGYASSGTQPWQGVFYPILVFAFLTSAICLAFMLLEVRGRQVTDFTEPQNLFALAMNSPSSARLPGPYGAGIDGHQLKERWYVAMEEDENYYIRTKAEENNTPPASTNTMSPVSLDLEEPGKSATPAMDEYRRLSSRKSFLSRFY